MKIKALLIGAAVLAAGALLAQTAGNVTFSSTSHFWRFQADAQYDAAGNVTAAPSSAFYQTTVTDSNGNAYPGATQQVSWDAVSTGNITVPITLADGTQATTTRGAILQAIIATATQVKQSADQAHSP